MNPLVPSSAGAHVALFRSDAMTCERAKPQQAPQHRESQGSGLVELRWEPMFIFVLPATGLDCIWYCHFGGALHTFNRPQLVTRHGAALVHPPTDPTCV